MKYRKISNLVIKTGSVIQNILIFKFEEKDHLKDLCADLYTSGRITFRLILNELNVKM